MKVFQLIITVRSPLSIAERKPDGQFQQALDCIPGALLRGAAADVLLDGDDSKANDSFFQKLFLGNNPLVFEDAHPSAENDRLTGYLPATVVSCKAEPGFRGDVYRPGHGVFDTLVDRVCIELLHPAALPAYNPICPDCHGRVERWQTFFGQDRRGEHYRRRAPHRLLTRVAINRRRGVAEDELLYSPTVISEVTTWKTDKKTTLFRGLVRTVLTDTEELGQLKAALEKIVYLGGGHSRGLGAVTVRAKEGTLSDDLVTRMESLQQAFAGRWGGYGRLKPQVTPEVAPDRGTFFTIGLVSDAVLRTAGGRPTMLLESAMLPGIQARRVRTFATYDYRGGWNAAWGLPKPTDVVAQKGSVYLFWAEQVDMDALRKLEGAGVGERRAEGFGRVVVCDPVHTVLWEGAK